jgi:hypothetical protein
MTHSIFPLIVFQCLKIAAGILDISQSYAPSQPVTEIALPLPYHNILQIQQELYSSFALTDFRV